MTSVATALETKIDNLLTVWVNGVSAQLMTVIAPLAMIGFTIYLILLGWQITRGEAHDPVHLIVKRTFMLAVVGSLGLTFGVYNTYVLQFVTWLPRLLVQTIAGTPTLNLTSLNATGAPLSFAANGENLTLGNVLDSVFQTYTNLYNLLFSHALSGFIPNFAVIISALFVAVALFLVIAIGLGFYLLARVELALCLGVGPVFIILAAFETTRVWTQRWIGQLWHYMLQIALMAAAVSMLQGMLVSTCITITQNYAANAGATSVFGDVLVLFLLSICVCVILWNIGPLTRALTGAAGSVGEQQVRQAGRYAGESFAAMTSSGAALVGRALQRVVTRSGGLNEIRQIAAPSGMNSGAPGSIPAAQRAAYDNITGG
jgi:type IV secretion system protein VirB6